MKKVVVFGATGYLGCYSALALAKAGYKVIAVGRRESDNGFFSAHGIDFIGGVVLECTGWEQRLEPVGSVDAVVHLAGTMPAHSGISPMPYVQGIVAATVNVCEWMRNIGCSRIVFNTTPSDVSAFFGGEEPIPDDSPRSFPKDGNDHSIYAICKNASVDILEYYKIKFGFSPIVFRHFMVYGWHSSAVYNKDGHPCILPYRKMIRDCIAGRKLAIWGNPLVKRDILYIEDFAEAIVTAVGSDVSGMFNLAGCKKYTLEEQVRTIAKVFSKSQKEVKYDCSKPSAPQLILSEEKTLKILGWKAKWDWETACKDMKKYYRSNSFEKLWGRSETCDTIAQ